MQAIFRLFFISLMQAVAQKCKIHLLNINQAALAQWILSLNFCQESYASSSEDSAWMGDRTDRIISTKARVDHVAK